MLVSLRNNSLVLLPIFAALLLEAGIRFISYQQPYANVYMLIHGQLLIEMLPFFISHYFACKRPTRPAPVIWLIGFIVYPLIAYNIALINSAYEQWRLLDIQGMLIALTSSLVWIIHRMNSRANLAATNWLSKIFSLDTMVALSLLMWSFVMAAVFVYTDNPMVNQPLKMIIDFSLIAKKHILFMHYFWQFCLMALVLFGIYWFNRYVLIRHLLAERGLIPFLIGGLVFILSVSAPISALLLLMPLNNIVEFTLIPSENQNPFDPFNYQMTFWLLMFSTPIILAFERKSQDAKMNDIARRQTHTELQLLQQQINPHFLFNTLNNLYALCLEQSPQAPDMIERLAGLLRYTVYQGQKERVALTDEIRYLQDYLALQSLRHTDDCHFHCQWPECSAHWEIPPLLLIIVLENAFKHGIETAEKPCSLHVSLTLIDNLLTFKCENPALIYKTSTDANNDGGLGLENLRRRLTLQFHKRHQLISEQRGANWYTCLKMELVP